MAVALLLATAGALTALLAHAVLTSSAGGIVAAVLLGGVGLALLRRRPTSERDIFVLVFGLGVIAAVLIYHYNELAYGAPYWAGGSDDLQYEEWAQSFRARFGFAEYREIRWGRLESPSTGIVTTPANNSPGYIYLIAALGQVLEWLGFPDAIIAFRLLNALVLGLAATLMVRVGAHLGLRPRVALAVTFATMLQPLVLWIAGHTLRDVLIVALLLALVLRWIRLDPYSTGREVLWTLLTSLAIVGVLTQLRLGQAYVAGAICGLGLWRWRGTSIGRRLVLAAGSVLVLVLLLSDIGGLSALDDAEMLLASIDDYSYRRSVITGGGLSLVVFETPMLPVGAVLRVAYLLVSPIPTVVGGLDNAVLGFATLVNISFMPFLMRGIREAWRSETFRLVLFAFAALFAGVAFFTFTIRQIVTYLPFAGLLVALGYERFQGDRRAWVAATFVTGTLIFSAYLLSP